MKRRSTLELIQKNYHHLEKIKNQTPEMQWAALNKSGHALQYVNNPTPEMCLAAVIKHPIALQHVPEELRTPDLCMRALQENEDTLDFVPNQTSEMCLVAMKKSTSAIAHIKDQALVLELLKKGDTEELMYWVSCDLDSEFFKYLLTVPEELPLLLGLCEEMDALVQNVLLERDFLKAHSIEDWKQHVANDKTLEGYEKWLTEGREAAGLDY